MHMKIILTLALVVFCVTATYPQRRSVVADLRFHKLESKVFGNTRTLRVLLPPGYNRDKNRRYPILYLNDGQNLFQVSTAQTSSTEWGVDETVKDLLAYREIEPLIIVGIDNAGRGERANEYLPWADKYLSPPLPNPQGAKYPDFLIGEVLPFIEKKYRVKIGAENRAIGGASYGALISLYTAIKLPGLFGSVLLESPSFYVNDAKILDETAEAKRLPSRFYLGVGTNEEAKKDCVQGDLSHEAVQDVLKLKKILLDKNLPPGNVRVLIDDCATHSEVAYGRRFTEALRFLYPRGKIIAHWFR